MPTPVLITDLSTTAASNFPAGSDSPANLDDVQRAHGAFIAQLRDGAHVPSATAKTIPADADLIPINDSAASNLIKKLTWANLKAALASTFQPAGSYAASGANSDITSLNALTNGVVGTSGNQSIGGIKTFSSMPVVPTQSMVMVGTGNGTGSTNTAIPRFTTTLVSQGSDITYADSAANGGSFTVNANGVYAISLTASHPNANGHAGISLNSAQLTTNIESITAANRLTMAQAYAATAQLTCSWTGYIASGGVVRVHTDTAALSANAFTEFTISRVT